MSAAPSTIKSGQVPSKPTVATRKEINLVSPAPFSPSTWNYLYYACMVASVAVGLGTILNGGAWQDAIIRLFVVLLGSSLLTILFLTFVIIPLHVARYKNMVIAQKAAILAAREKATNRAAKESAELDAELAELTEQDLAKAASATQAEIDMALQTDNSTGTSAEPDHDDQATSLRRMAASGRT